MDGAHLTTTFSGAQNAGVQIGQQLGTFINVQQAPSNLPDFQGDYFHIALTTSSNFVARVKHRKQIEEQLLGERKDREHRLLVITGLGGAGKSQLALDFLSNHRDEYISRFWIDSQSTTSIERDFAQIFASLFPSEQIPAKFDIVLSRVKMRFQRETGMTLVVFDGADSVNYRDETSVDLKRYLPRLPGVHVIVTSRLLDLGHLSSLQAVRVQEMEDEEARQLFRKCSGVYDQEETVNEIITELGNFALAVTLAGCHVAQDPDMIADSHIYLREVRERRAEILELRPNAAIDEYDQSVLSTWELSYDRLKRQSPIAARLLTCLSFLARTNIFPELFREHGLSEKGPEGLAPLWKDLLSSSNDVNFKSVKEALNTITAFSFANRTGRAVSIHRLVYDWGYYRLDASEQQFYSYQATNALQSTLAGTALNWQSRSRLVPHIIANLIRLRDTFEVLSADQLTSLEVLNDMSVLLMKAGFWLEYFDLMEYIHKSSLTQFGETDLRTIDALSNLAGAFQQKGDNQQAILLLEKALSQRRALFGDDDLNAVSELCALGQSMVVSGDPQKAISMLREALEKRQRLLGHDHERTISAQISLAVALFLAGSLSEARIVQEACLDVCRKAFPADHDSILDLESQLANMLNEEGKLHEAKELFQSVIAKKKQSLGFDHPYVIYIELKYSMTLLHLGKVDEASAIQRRGLQTLQNSVGNDHPNVIMAWHAYSWTLRTLGELDEAISLQKFCIERYKQLYGEDYRDIFASKTALATMLCDQGKHGEASQIFLEVMTKRKNTHGVDHPTTIMSEIGYAFTLQQLGQPDEAIAIQEPVVKRSIETFGEDNHITLRAMQNLATSLVDRGRFDVAGEIYPKVLQKRQQIFGEDHVDIVDVMICLAKLLDLQGKSSEALLLIRESIDRYHNLIGDDHPYTIRARGQLANMLKKMKEYNEAKKILLDIIPKFEKLFGPTNEETVMKKTALAGVLCDSGNPNEAAVQLEQLLSECQQTLGSEHPSTLTVKCDLARIHLLDESKDKTRVLQSVHEVVEARRRVLGKNHAENIWPMTLLGAVYSERNQQSEAEECLLEAVGLSKQIRGDSHPQTTSIIVLLGEVRKRQENLPSQENADEGEMVHEQQSEPPKSESGGAGSTAVPDVLAIQSLAISDSKAEDEPVGIASDKDESK